MVYNYNKHSILITLVEFGNPFIFNELIWIMRKQIKDGHQIKINNQTEEFPIVIEVLLESDQDIESWFRKFKIN